MENLLLTDSKETIKAIEVIADRITRRQEAQISYINSELNICLQENFNIEDEYYRSCSIAEKLSEYINELSAFESFCNKENEIDISIEKAQRLYALTEEISSLCYQNKSSANYLQDHSKKLKQKKKIETIISLSNNKEGIVTDVLSLKKEFKKVFYNPNEDSISVQTEDIILTHSGQTINFGPFIISYFGASSNIVLRAKAISPKRHCSKGVVHPHVGIEGYICIGEAEKALTTAHKSGNILDIFLIANSLLSTYNPSSPYATLETWVGLPCDHCGKNRETHSLYRCEKCHDKICIECFVDTKYGLICKTCLAEEKNKCPRCGTFIMNKEENEICQSCITLEDILSSKKFPEQGIWFSPQTAEEANYLWRWIKENINIKIPVDNELPLGIIRNIALRKKEDPTYHSWISPYNNLVRLSTVDNFKQAASLHPAFKKKTEESPSFTEPF